MIDRPYWIVNEVFERGDVTMLDYLKKLIQPTDVVQPHPAPDSANIQSSALSSKALQEALGSLPIDQPLLTLDLDPRFRNDCYPAIMGGYIVPNGLVLDTPGGRQVIKRSVFRRVKLRQDTPTTGTVFLEANDECIIKLAGLRNFEEVADVLVTLVLVG